MTELLWVTVMLTILVVKQGQNYSMQNDRLLHMSIFLINYFVLNIDPKTKPTQKISSFWKVCKTKSVHCTEPAGDDD